MTDLLFLIIPNIFLFIMYKITFYNVKYINKYYLITSIWLLILTYYLYEGHTIWKAGEAGTEISYFGNMVTATTGGIFSGPILLYLRYKNIEPLWIIWILILLPIASIFIIFFSLALTGHIWGM